MSETDLYQHRIGPLKNEELWVPGLSIDFLIFGSRFIDS